MEAIVLCDVKFGAAPIQSAIDYLAVEKRYRVVGAALITPEPSASFELDVPTVSAPDAGAAIRLAASSFRFRAILDLTDGTAPDRLVWANEALQLGLEVHGADYRLWPSPSPPASGVPSISFVGVSPRSGKTAAVVYAVRELLDKYKPVAIVLGLAGPAYAEVVKFDPGRPPAPQLLSFYRDGREVAGGHYQIAAAAGIPAVGCSFAGTGFTGVPVNSVIRDGTVLAGEAGGDFFLYEGSGAAMAPCDACGNCFLMRVGTDAGALKVFPAAYHLKRADVVVVTGYTAEPPRETLEGLGAALKSLGVKAPLQYATLEPEAARAPEMENAVIVTPRPPAAREPLKRFWAGLLKGRVFDVLASDEYPPRGDAAKVIRKSGEEAGLVLDLASSHFGSWLELAHAWNMPVELTFDVLKPSKPFIKTLLARTEGR